MNNEKVAVWVSCGAASAVAAYLAVKNLHGKGFEVVLVNQPIAEEHLDNQRFLRDLSICLNHPIISIYDKKYLSMSARDVWQDRDFMSGPNGAPCTAILKRKCRRDWQEQNKIDWHVFGFTIDEQKRHDRFVVGELSNVMPLLIDANFTKQDCADFVVNVLKIDLPMIYSLGFPNANCIGCVKATSPTYWNHVRDIFPQIFNDRAQQSRKIGAKLTRVKGQRIFLDELLKSDLGQPLKTLKMPDCGIFCEETL